MATMTIEEAEHIIGIVATALIGDGTSSNGEKKRGHFCRHYEPISILQGYDIFQIDIALKLRLANWFLFHADRSDFEEQFAEDMMCCRLPFGSLSYFIPYDLIAKLEQLDVLSKTLSRDSLEFLKREQTVNREVSAYDRWILENEKFLSLETTQSFGDFCKSIGATDPIYWQKIYTRLGLEYTSSAPKGNAPVYSVYYRETNSGN
ncbi:MAG: hypothetical protein NTW44_03600 [Nitrospirae bacterium]|nr:hypothetical protein [Nitrospirota bacterium]